MSRGGVEKRPPPVSEVAVTGLAVISPLGCTVKDYWAALINGGIGTRPVTRFEASQFGSANGGEVAGFDPDRHLPDRVLCELPLSVQYSVAAVTAAASDAGIDGSSDVSVCMGTVMGSRPHLERLDRSGNLSSLDVGRTDASALARVPAETCGFDGAAVVVSSGCSAGNDAIGHGWDLIHTGRADCVVVGGAEELSEAVYALFTSLRALAPEVVRPFDLNRAGILPAEGAAALVLESGARAHSRGARVYARLLGYACGADAYHVTAPHPRGRALVACLDDALERSAVSADSVDYVSAHGTGTPASDGIEASALATVFDGSRRPAVSSIKGALGHAQGSASAFEALSCVLAIQDGLVPGMPTVHQVDPACAGVDLVVGTSRAAPVRVAASVAFGFGGSASALVFGEAR